MVGAAGTIPCPEDAGISETRTTATAPGLDRRVLLGVLLMCTASTIFPVMNGLVQVLSRYYPSEQLIWARVLSHLLIVLAILVPREGWAIIVPKRPMAQFLRSCLLLGSTTLFFFGVKEVPLAKAACISLMSPFFVTLLAWPMLGERIRVLRLAAVVLGFLGVIVVIQPGGAVFQWAALLIVGSALCYALYQVYTRGVAGQDRPETSVIWSALVGSVVFTLVVPIVWVTPSLVDALLMAALGAMGAAGHYCVARAMTYAQANVLSPFQYWQIIGSVLVGYVVSGLFPEPHVWLGAAIIVAAGLIIALTAARRGKA
ncbi:MAG: DMT family transporter [Acetobacteraceae bacterium]|nr:DMT family transporter [Acetobacteraceae bacterium]